MGTTGISGITLQQDYIASVNVCTENDEALYRHSQGVGTVEKLSLFVCSSDSTITTSLLQLNSMIALSSVVPGMRCRYCGIPSQGQKKPGTHRPGIMTIR